MVSGSIEERKKDEYDQVLTFWKCWKTLPVPDVTQDGNDPVWGEIAQSMHDCYEDHGGDLLFSLLNAGMDYLNNDWKRRKANADK